jgi:hypothetical protein
VRKHPPRNPIHPGSKRSQTDARHGPNAHEARSSFARELATQNHATRIEVGEFGAQNGLVDVHAHDHQARHVCGVDG